MSTNKKSVLYIKVLIDEKKITFKLDFFNGFIFKILSITIFREITLKVSLGYDITLISKTIPSFEPESRILNFGFIFMHQASTTRKPGFKS